jgi:hypothetical protein
MVFQRRGACQTITALGKISFKEFITENTIWKNKRDSYYFTVSQGNFATNGLDTNG